MNVWQRCLFSCGMLALAACGGGAGGTAVAPGPALTATPLAPLAPLAARVDALAAPLIAASLAPSVVVAVAHRGRPTLIRAYGTRNIATGEAADVGTAYQIGSLTKAFTAAAILLLAQEGRLTLDDTFAHWVPEYTRGAAVSLRQALSMTSGIPADYAAAFTTFRGPLDEAGMIAQLNAHPLDFPPGTNFAYSNQGYYLLGVVVERASGQSWTSYVHDRFITPLNLTQTSTLADPPLSNDVAQGYWHGNLAGGALQPQTSWSYGYLFSFGSLVSTARDVVAWDEALRGGTTALNAASTAAMFTVPFPGISPTYALGWFIDPDGSRFHDGETTGFHSAHALFPDGYTVVVLGNDWDDYTGSYDPIALLEAVHAATATSPL